MSCREAFFFTHKSPVHFDERGFGLMSVSYDNYANLLATGRGQFSYAAVLADEGKIDEALGWLHKALNGGNLNFLRVAGQMLSTSTDPRIHGLVTEYQQRARELTPG